MPVYFHLMFGEIFYEGGKAWGLEMEGAEKNQWLNSAGLELNLSTILLRLMEIAPGVGIAYASDREERKRHGDDEKESEDTDQKMQVYLSIKASVNF